MKSWIVTKQGLGIKTIYRYDGNPKDDEIVVNKVGDIHLCRVGDIIRRNGKRWLVNVVRSDLDIVRSATPSHLHRVFVTAMPELHDIPHNYGVHVVGPGHSRNAYRDL